MAEVAILSAGEMGAGIGGALARAGHRVTTVLEGRGAETQARAAEAGMVSVADLAALVEGAAFVLSIVPPAVATQTARQLAEVVRRTGARPVFVECNAIAPATSASIAELFDGTGAVTVDGGIVGGPPPTGQPRLYVSGPEASRVTALASEGVVVVDLGPAYGDASALKMVYASLTKGLNTLLTAALVTARRSGVFEPFVAELAASQPEFLRRAEGAIPRLPADAGRWVREMEEIARTYGDAGMPADFHTGAAKLMAILDASEFGRETRRTLDRSRSMAATIEALAGD